MLLAAFLTALQVPGLADTTRRASATHAMAVVDSARLHAVGARSPAHALAPAVASATAITTDGVPGIAPVIVLRGGAIHGVSDPVVLIDGIVSRGPLRDIDVDDIDRIEVLNGPASAAVYGLGAANGVIRVFTRRGRRLPGAGLRFVARSELSTHLRPGILPVNQHRALDPDGIHDDEYPVTYDAPSALLHQRTVLANHVSVQQLDRTMVGGLFASLRHERDPGMLPLKSGFDEKAVRLNLDRVFGKRLSMDGGAFVLLSSNDLPPNQGTLFSVLRFVEPHGKLDSLLSPCPNFDACYTANVPAGTMGSLPNPLRTLQNAAIDDSRRRVRGGINASYRVTHWLDARAGFTTDQTNLRGFSRFNPSTGPESTVDGEDRSSISDVILTATRDLHRIRTTTHVGWSRERSVRASETIIITPGSPSASSALEITEINPSYFAATTLDVGRRLRLEGAVRRDEPSLYGSVNRATYHRFGANVHLSDFIRLRAAHGTSGVAVADSQLFDVVVGPGPFMPLRLPFVHESEAGTTLSFGRASIGYDFAVQRTVGHAMSTPIPTSSGFGVVFRNVGNITTRAHELSLTAPVLDRQSVGWRVDLVAQRARSIMSKLDVPPFFTGPLSTFQLREGQELNVVAGRRFIRTEAELVETISSGQLTGTVADYVRNEEGYYVRSTQHRTASEVPLTYARCTQTTSGSCTAFETLFPLGRTTPDVALGLTSSARWKSLSLHVALTGAIGGVIYNQGRNTDIALARDALIDQSAKPVAERKPAAYYQAFRTGVANELFVESGTHAKLRDVALDWRVWRRVSVGVVGRNLWTSGDYSGHDPDVAVPGTNLLERNVDRFQYPAPRMAGVVVKMLAPEPRIVRRSDPRRTAVR